ncbi:surfeit locus protein [Gonapodya sp. JEL0774]|nr:surfeit locus protein [Gonapodya sp. JEL0774]
MAKAVEAADVNENTQSADLAARLARHASAFDTLVSLIPPAFYFPRKDDQDGGGKFAHNKKRKAPQQEVKEATKKAKRAKLDPDNLKTVVDIQNDELKKREKNNSADEDEYMDTDENDGGDHMSDSEDEKPSAPKSTTATTHRPTKRVLSAASAASSPADLRARLQERIAKLREKRHASPQADGSGRASPGSRESSPRSKMDIIEARRAQKREDRKARKLALREKKKEGSSGVGHLSTKTSNVGNLNSHVVPANRTIPSTTDLDPTSDDFVFGKLDLPESTASAAAALKSKTKPTSATSAAQQLQKLAAQKNKLEQMRERGEGEKADAIEEKSKWGKLQAMAEGSKVRDDVKLLQKTVKREQKSKEKSRKEWYVHTPFGSRG